MKQKKAMAMGLLLTLILMVLGTVVGVTLLVQEKDSIVSSADKFLSSNFNFLFIEEATEEDLAKYPVPIEYSAYAQVLTKQVFDSSTYQEGLGSHFIFVDAFREGELENYDDIAIMFANSGDGIFVFLYHNKLDKKIPLYDPLNNEYLRGKKLCILPVSENSYGIASLLADELEVLYEHRMPVKDILSRGEVNAITLFFTEENDMRAIGGDREEVIFKYEQNTEQLQIPLYVNDDTICFLGIGDESSVNIDRYGAVQGKGQLHEITLRELQIRDDLI